MRSNSASLLDPQHNQPQLSGWLRNPDLEQSQIGTCDTFNISQQYAEYHSEGAEGQEDETNEMTTRINNMDKKLKQLSLQNEQLKNQNLRLTRQCEDLCTNLATLENRLVSAENKIEKQEAQSRRDNLMFYNIPQEQSETWENSENKVRSYLKSELDVDETKIRFERAHRVQTKKKTGTQPIVVKLSHFKDRDKVLKTFRAKRKERREQAAATGSQDSDNLGGQTDQGDNNTFPPATRPISVAEDYTERVRQARRNLQPFLQRNLQANKKVYLKYDKIVIENVTFLYDENTAGLKPI